MGGELTEDEKRREMFKMIKMIRDSKEDGVVGEQEFSERYNIISHKPSGLHDKTGRLHRWVYQPMVFKEREA